MQTMLITGVGGLVGSATAEHFHARGYRIIGVDNDLRGRLLGDPRGSTQWNIDRLASSLTQFKNYPYDVREQKAIEEILSGDGRNTKVIVHCAAQTAHEGEVTEDFEINTIGTLNLLKLWRKYCPEAVFIYLSTIKVFGNYPCTLQYVSSPTRLDLVPSHRYFKGFDESVSIDQGMSSFFGRSKTAADLYVQEYSYQYGLHAVCFRASCITGGLHSGTEAHGMLSYMMRCAATRTPYRIYGYHGLQVRDQIHGRDLAMAFEHVIKSPKRDVVFNIGGGRENACSVLEAIDICERITGNKMTVSHGEQRHGDHPWWITDNTRFHTNYPEWKIAIPLSKIFEDIYAIGAARWTQ